MPHDPLLLDALAGTVDRFGRNWNAYELHGAAHVPRDGGCLLVLYHGLVPLDAWYLVARLYREYGLFVRSLSDRWLFDVPGLSQLAAAGGAVAGTREAAVRMLRDGNPVLVSPGGVREAIAGPSHYYRVHWGSRLGFAHVALEADVPLIPVFGENVEELYRAPWSGTAPVQWLYRRVGVPIMPLVGMGPLPFPVKVRTWMGRPLHPRAGESAESLRSRMELALQGLIDEHQRPRPRLLRGLAERLGGTP